VGTGLLPSPDEAVPPPHPARNNRITIPQITLPLLSIHRCFMTPSGPRTTVHVFHRHFLSRRLPPLSTFSSLALTRTALKMTVPSRVDPTMCQSTVIRSAFSSPVVSDVTFPLWS
jgi:hypothetical protein